MANDFDLEVLKKYEKEGLISIQKHPALDLWIYNYTHECVFKKKWDDTTTQCRGLILDKYGKVVARPFKKFFNYGEQDITLPEGTPTIYKKMDGSLIICTSWEENLIVATRGSFISDQAKLAEHLILNNEKLLYMINHSTNFTYLFEVVGPSNRIVCTYEKDRLILLSAISTWNGLEHSLDYYRIYNFLEVVEEYKVEWRKNSIEELKNLNLFNEEGFVLKWSNGFRLKIKFEDYVCLHRLLTGITEKVVWELLRDNKDIDVLRKNVPEEFLAWLDTTRMELAYKFYKIVKECQRFVHVNDLRNLSRKDAANCIIKNKKEYQAVLFSLLDNDVIRMRENVYKLIKPTSLKTFVGGKE